MTAGPLPRLPRELGPADAVVVGLGAMLGTGAFTVWGAAAEAAGPALLLGLALAAFVATCNATSSADLAALESESGGAYAWGRRWLGAGAGRLAGWAFVGGKSASAAAAATAFGRGVTGHGGAAATLAALAAVAGAALLDAVGVRWTARVARVVVLVVLAVLAVAVVSLLSGGVAAGRLTHGATGGPLGVLHAAALLFFAFAGYARITTLGEQVRDPRRTLPRAVVSALAVALAVYATVGLACLLAVGAPALGGSSTPLADAVRQAESPEWTVAVVRLGAVVATLSVLVLVLSAVARTTLAMARYGDLPRTLAAVGPRGTPWRADLAAGAAAAVLVTVLRDPRPAIAVSAASVLVYYAVANASATRLPPGERRVWRWLAPAGLAGCVVLALAVPLGVLAG